MPYGIIIYVAADSGVNCIEDLVGKKFYAGIPASVTATALKAACEKKGISVDWFSGSVGDAIGAMKDRRIIGLAMWSIALMTEASILNVTEWCLTTRSRLPAKEEKM